MRVVLVCTTLLFALLAPFGVEGEHHEALGRQRREVIVNWNWGTEAAYALTITSQIKATGVLLMVPPQYWDRPDLVQERIQAYRAHGFDVYLYFGNLRIDRRTIEPRDIQGLIALEQVRGIAVNFFGRRDPREAEAALLKLSDACKAAGKLFAYYHGDGLSNVQAKMLSSRGLIVWAWYTGVWKPRTWDVHPIWAQMAIFNRDGRYTTKGRILAWYQRLPRQPEAIVWWQTTNKFEPTEEQVEGMRAVAEQYLARANQSTGLHEASSFR